MKFLATALLALLVAAPAAHASYAYPNQRDAASNPTVAKTITDGTKWLGTQNVQPCPNVTVLMAPDFSADGNGIPGGGRAIECTVWLELRLVSAANNRRDWYASFSLCAVAVHELAHTAGIEHGERMTRLNEAAQSWCDRRAWRLVLARR